jgi:hypothetical protein
MTYDHHHFVNQIMSLYSSKNNETKNMKNSIDQVIFTRGKNVDRPFFVAGVPLLAKLGFR